ncbi:two-component sensor histidine kinase [Rhodobacter aestuarii]|uniref:histidine kinase n=1 Tax=Rhodobacter aestuarii TaxID=453582 RepID=A0A1N7M0R6_9RHOB|nr:sensor histidine kinase [Rhodobacter aestuarii]PTV94766.1 two-component sensor histidine kinase [Rhodobacter aestuarii]SIS79686.1 Two-component sensor histidine kinase, contains HisKA and HATPase domains [Rhodobacter aestuarii]
MSIWHKFRTRADGLGARLMLGMGVVLLPLALLSFAQSMASNRLAESRMRAAILGETLMAAGPQIDLLMQARGTAMAMAAGLPQWIEDTDTCSAHMRHIVETAQEDYSFVGFVPLDGQIICTSDDKPFDVQGNAWFNDIRTNPRPLLYVNREGPISGTSILNFSLPVRDDAGALLGFASVSMPHAGFETRGIANTVGGDRPLTILTFDAKGEVLTSTTGLDDVARALPSDRPLGQFVGQGGNSFLAKAADGRRRAFAVVPLSEGNLYLLASWPADTLDDEGMLSNWPPFAFPFLMWAASLLVAWLAAESQVLRHVRVLHASITSFARGDRRVRHISMAGAPSELRDVARAHEHMTDSVLRDEAYLENVIHQKEVLLREVHHRVKNNLQLIASILNMQLRRAKSEETRAAMKNVQERVLSLATIHRELYLTSGQTDIRADELLPRIAHHILKIGSTRERRFDLDLEVQDIRLVPDQAVALALLLTEALDNVLKHAWRGQRGVAAVRVAFTRQDDGSALLEVANSLAPEDAPQLTVPPTMVPPSDGFGTRLLAAFAAQLQGRMARGREGETYRLSLRFTPTDLQAAEERHCCDGPQSEI